MPANERRKHPRLSLSVAIDFSSDHNFYAGKTRDLSVGGLFIEAPIELPLGTHLTVDLSFLGCQLALDAEIVWHVLDQGRVVGMGLRFLAPSAEAETEITKFMQSRAPVAFDASPLPPPLPDAD